MNQFYLTIDLIRKYFSGYPAALINTLGRMPGGDDAAVLLAAALASRAAEEGHACVDLAALAGQPLAAGEATERRLVCPPLDVWRGHLEASPLVGNRRQWRPLILERNHFLYLQRFHYCEQMIARHLRDRANRTCTRPADGVWLKRVRQFFPEAPPGKTDWQAVAAVIALLRRLCIISGAPGTGKTTAAARIIGLLIDVHTPHPLRFALCAPTGKAAARLGQALRAATVDLPGGSTVRQSFPTEAATIHRLLDYRRGRFRFNAANPLAADVVVVDEASMIDLALMARLLEAVPLDARLIILGDHHQLSSVEAGAVMGDICQGNGWSCSAADIRAACRQLQIDLPSGDGTVPARAAPLQDNVVVLTRNFRFDERQGIGALVSAVKQGDRLGVREQVYAAGQEIQWIPAPVGHAQRRRLQETIIEGYRPILEAPSVAQALEALDNFMVLGALTGGPWGTERLNLWIESLLRQAGSIATGDIWYPGRPVLVRRNDYHAGLFNGDVGIVGPKRGSSRRGPRIWFRSPAGPLLSFTPSELPEHQTALALTVHKSQGSEYQRIVLALPENDSPVLTRELLYTGLSRARRQIWLVAGERILDLTVNRRIDRVSGLKAALERLAQGAAGDAVRQEAEGETER